MGKRVTVVFDGSVLRPDTHLDLTPNTRYVITIQELNEASSPEDAWDALETMVTTIEAAPDWASEHEHYLYDTPKREFLDNDNNF